MLSDSESKMLQVAGMFKLLALLIILGSTLADDVHLRIAERRVIPGYIRHAFEYPDIDIKRIMKERGFTLKRRFRGQQVSRNKKGFQGHNDCDWRYNTIACINTIGDKYH